MWQFSRNSHQIFVHINANESLKWNECSILMFYQRMEIIEIANHLSLQFAYIETYILRWNILPMVKFCLRLYKSHFLRILNKLNGAEGRNLAFNLKLLICQFECGLIRVSGFIFGHQTPKVCLSSAKWKRIVENAVSKLSLPKILRIQMCAWTCKINTF